MKSLEEIKIILSNHYPILKKDFGIDYLGLFGSYAKGIENEKSDIDILVNFPDDVEYKIDELNEYLEKLLNAHLHITTLDLLFKPISHKSERDISKNILKEVVRINAK